MSKYVLLKNQSDCYFIAESLLSIWTDCPVEGAKLTKVTYLETVYIWIRDVEQFDPYQGALYKRRIERVYSITWEDWCSKGINHTREVISDNEEHFERELIFEVPVIEIDDLSEFAERYPCKVTFTEYKLDGEKLVGLTILGH